MRNQIYQMVTEAIWNSTANPATDAFVPSSSQSFGAFIFGVVHESLPSSKKAFHDCLD